MEIKVGDVVEVNMTIKVSGIETEKSGTFVKGWITTPSGDVFCVGVPVICCEVLA